MGAKFRTILFFEGLDTGDGRFFNIGGFTPRALPLTMMGMRVNPEMGGHGLAEVAARLDEMNRVEATGWADAATGQPWGAIAGGPVWAWVGLGEFGDDEPGQAFEQMVRDGRLRGVSADLAEMTWRDEAVAFDEDGWPTEWKLIGEKGMIGGATICNIPAFRGCTIEIIEETADASTEETALPIAASARTFEHEPLDAGRPWLPAWRELPAVDPMVAAGGPVRPPVEWFANPMLDRLTAPQVDDDGRVFGHIAPWDEGHTAAPDRTAPHSATGYALFLTGYVRCADGTDVPVGQITLGAGHASTAPGVGARAAAEHYDNTCSAVADIFVGEDSHGIWFAGALRPGVTDDQVRVLRASPLSGDWRPHGRGLEMIAALAVNVQGFPIPRVVVASGRVTALVAAGAAAVDATRTHDEDTARLTQLVTAGVVAALDHRDAQAAAVQREAAAQEKRRASAAAAMARIHASTNGPAIAAARARIDAALGEGGVMS